MKTHKCAKQQNVDPKINRHNNKKNLKVLDCCFQRLQYIGRQQQTLFSWDGCSLGVFCDRKELHLPCVFCGRSLCLTIFCGDFRESHASRGSICRATNEEVTSLTSLWLEEFTQNCLVSFAENSWLFDKVASGWIHYCDCNIRNMWRDCIELEWKEPILVRPTPVFMDEVSWQVDKSILVVMSCAAAGLRQWKTDSMHKCHLSPSSSGRVSIDRSGLIGDNVQGWVKALWLGSDPRLLAVMVWVLTICRTKNKTVGRHNPHGEILQYLQPENKITRAQIYFQN